MDSDQVFINCTYKPTFITKTINYPPHTESVGDVNYCVVV